MALDGGGMGHFLDEQHCRKSEKSDRQIQASVSSAEATLQQKQARGNQRREDRNEYEQSVHQSKGYPPSSDHADYRLQTRIGVCPKWDIIETLGDGPRVPVTPTRGAPSSTFNRRREPV